MAFITFGFYIFLAVIVIVYYILPLKYRWYSLLAGSIVFYWYLSGYSKKKFLSLIVSALICYVCGRFISEKKRKKLYLFLGIAFSAIPLLMIKEAPFVSARITYKPLPSWWIVPVGMSFWSLQMIAYLADIYRGGDYTAEKFS